MERRLCLQPDAYVLSEGHRARITQVVDLETVLVEDVETGKARHVKVQALQPAGLSPETPGKAESVELVDITDQDWQRARTRFETIRPLLDDPNCTRAKQLLAKLDDLLTHPKTHRMPNLLIVGDTNAGKTMSANRFVQLHPADDNPDGDAAIVPVLAIQAPPGPARAASIMRFWKPASHRITRASAWPRSKSRCCVSSKGSACGCSSSTKCTTS